MCKGACCLLCLGHPTLLLKSLFQIGCFVCICILCKMSSKNPFESYIIGNLTNYFYVEETYTTLFMNYTKSNNDKISHINRIKHKLSRGKYNSSVKDLKRKNVLRKLVADSFCTQIQDNFVRYKGKKLSTIFDLNYGKIHRLSIANLVVFCVLFFISFVTMCILSYEYKAPHKATKVIIPIFFLISSLLYVANFLLSLILLYFMEKGDIEKYDDFLDCKKVKRWFFKEFSDVHKLRGCFFAFLVLNIVNQGIEKIEAYFKGLNNFFETMEKEE